MGSAAGAQARPASFSTPSTVTVQFTGPAPGNVVQGIPQSFVGADLPAQFGNDVLNATYQQRSSPTSPPGLNVDNVTGISVLSLLTQLRGVASHVTSVDLQAGTIVQVLHPEAGDLDASGSAGFPFANGFPPVVTHDANTGDITAYVNYRDPPAGRPGVIDTGAVVSVSNGANLLITVHLDGSLLFPVVNDPPSTVAAETPFTVAAGLADGSDPGRYGWTWDFGDGVPDPSRSPSTTHTFAASGTYTLQAAAEGTGSDRSSGLSAPVKIQVTPAEPITPPSTPPPSPSVQPSLGNGVPSGPNGGPVAGSGPRVGGAATSRAGGAPPGPSYDPRSSSAPASGTAGAAADGQLVGYLLSGSTAGVPQAAQAAASPLDDAAPAARSGVGPGLLGWLGGALVVVALLVLGAGTERRRPSHVRRTRLPTRRAR